MSAGVPWSVSAVDQDTWDAAREAARREGLSVGEWLEAAIRENTRGGYGRGRNPATNFDHRLDDLAEQINLLARRNAQARPQPQFQPEPPLREKGGEQIAASLDSLTGRIDLMLASMERAERNNGREEISSAIRKLDSRIETILHDRPARREDSVVDGKLDEMARVISQMSERLEREVAVTTATTPQYAPTADELDAAVAEIMERQSVLDGTPRRRAPVRAAAPKPPRETPAPAPQFANFERQLKTIADEMQSLRKANEKADFAHVAELRRDIADLARSMADLAPRRTLESLEQTVEALARKVDRATLNSPKDTRSAQAVLTALEEIRTALANVRPAESFLSVEGDLNALSDKLDVINAKSIDGTTVARIQNQIQEVRDLLSNALPAQNLQTVVAQIEAIAGKVERISVPDDSGIRNIVGALEQRIDALADRIETSAQTPVHIAAEPNHEAFDRIHQRLDALQHTLDKVESPDPMGLEETMRGLVDRLDASEAKLANLGAIERGISDLSTQFDKARANAMDVAERAAKTALRELHAARQTMPQQIAAAQQQVTSPVPLQPEIPNEKPLAGEPAPTSAPKPAPKRNVTVVSTPEDSQRFTRAAPVAVRSQDEFVVTDELPADYPLEPGSGAPRSRPTPVQQRIAQSEAAVADITPRPRDTSVKTSDFIAAARRAAQAAAAEAPDEPAPEGAPDAKKKVSIAGLFARSRRAVLLGLLVVLLGFSVVRFFDVRFITNLIGGSETAVARPPAPAKETPPQQPAVPPQTQAVPPAVQQRSMIPGIIDPTASLAPSSGILAPQQQNSLFARIPDDALTTQSTPATTPNVQQIAVQPVVQTQPQKQTQKQAPAPTHTQAAIPASPAPQTNAGELPAGIGTQALRHAALNGDPAAAFEIGERYLNGTGVAANTHEAIKWFERAVGKGSAAAAFRLGMAYEKGQGVERDRGRARTNYIRAAEGGHLKAMHNLAVMIVEDSGPGGKPDYTNAIPWFRRAADRGLRDSQYNLGVLYARGLGVPANLAESYRWFSLAANQGDADAAKKRDDVAKRLDQQTLVAAQLAVQTWAAAPSDAAINNPPLKAEWQTVMATPKKKQKK